MAESTDPIPGAGALPPALAETARQVFGARLPLAERYAELLATEGTVRGLVGPRETPRLWDRHLLNCAVLAELLPVGSVVADVGSGAGLPGIVLGVARPDLSIVLIESLARRTAFLDEVVDELQLSRVTVVRGRAEELAGRIAQPDVVTARAVASLDRLVRWCLPLLPTGGRLLAMKGASAGDEVAEHAAQIRRAGGDEPRVLQCGVGLVEPATTVVEVVRLSGANGKRKRGRADT
ncbi:16S rRNA (guanine(527)-N(7))-methyltransferase RsmG [Actinocatenispora sera]|uniref:16S rRNA (guanine(527)-N(7))-methyltransferase RsmG n=1 Tax=Actinocatenispora sera TaxID=390989 RepID=UPI0033CFF7A0